MAPRCDCAFRNAGVFGGNHCVSDFSAGLDIYSLVVGMKRRPVNLGLKVTRRNR
jgi:hypothetical protein